LPIHEQDEYPQEDKLYKKLGKKIKTYPAVWTDTYRWGFIIVGVFLIVLSSLFVVINAFNLLNTINQHGRAVLLSRSHPVLINLFAVFPLGLLSFILGIHHWHDSTKLYENGFLYQQGKLSQIWMWSEITSFDSKFKEIVFAGSSVARLEEIILKNKDGQSITIKNRNQKSTEFVSKIRQRVLPILHQNAINILRIGKRIQFHDGLAVKLGGIEINGTIYPWTTISMGIKKAGIFELISKTDQQTIFHQHIRDIENFDTLTHLITNPPTAYISIRDNTSYAEDVRPDQYIER